MEFEGRVVNQVKAFLVIRELFYLYIFIIIQINSFWLVSGNVLDSGLTSIT